MSLQAIKYDGQNKTLEILDQLKLPHQSIYVPIRNVQDAFKAIKDMVVRGAPAIAIVAALSLAVELNQEKASFKTTEEAKKAIVDKLDYLVGARPTAVNLGRAANDLKKLVAESSSDVVDKVIKAAEQMLVDDVSDNENIGHYGAEWIMSQVPKSTDRISVLTICNTGSLATAGYGTALGVIRSLHAAGNLEHAYCLETRPYNQGSRLTAYELVHDKIPATLITDSMASSLLRAHPEIKLIVVGADRVAANGDTANKIGTYQLAVVAKHHGVKFVVAAPNTTIDLNTPNGDAIVIEQRAPHELTQVKGAVVEADGTINPDKAATVSTAAPGIGVWNPSFDVTPHELIDAVVTEKRAFTRQPGAAFNFRD
ncbi:S-methyl-5-thioribose-1-phosphate isomerase MRI1 [Sugiyamaella lignohabitans]|uniref:Methylthioribose-1-phosphate isomerase n=1 Tax=Sugiyamaella lignohabitans TaxID=796027 RepID=A0A161HJ59_9ASCO|nr:S-methyl-5-thioribose-1-phosphate isomerase MRI1 [Sugiyamaella lignohabitans]ANB11378.1 S-methyl-5-thioribose-1-phosphate isomerase MRI1 [Sugiyamaella lignohabitans]